MGTGARRASARAASIGLALGAAVGWASYYLFVLWGAPGTPPSAVLVYPFVVGGAALTTVGVARGGGASFRALFASGAAYARGALMLTCQVTVLSLTYLAGPVDPALLSLIGDVVVTPVLAAALFAGPRVSLRRPGVVAGLAVSLVGGSLTIAGGHRLGDVHGIAWLAVVVCPLVVAAYFLFSARAAEELPMPVVVGQSMLVAALGAALVAPLVPGGVAGLVRVSAPEAGLLAVNGLVSFALAPALYFVAIRREGIVLPPMLMTAIPVFTLLFSTWLLGERLPAIALAGIPVCVAGAVLALGAMAPGGSWSGATGAPAP